MKINFPFYSKSFFLLCVYAGYKRKTTRKLSASGCVLFLQAPENHPTLLFLQLRAEEIKQGDTHTEREVDSGVFFMKIHLLGMKIVVYRKITQVISIIHEFRSRNGIADALAKQGLIDLLFGWDPCCNIWGVGCGGVGHNAFVHFSASFGPGL